MLLLAQAKVEDVVAEPARRSSRTRTTCSLLGCDSMLELDGEIYGKPPTPPRRRARWRAMRGRSGVLHTGHWLMDERDVAGDARGDVVDDACTVRGPVRRRRSTPTSRRASRSRWPARSPIDGLGGPFVERIEGDHHGVVGLSLPLLRELLGEVGVSIPDLWREA